MERVFIEAGHDGFYSADSSISLVLSSWYFFLPRVVGPGPHWARPVARKGKRCRGRADLVGDGGDRQFREKNSVGYYGTVVLVGRCVGRAIRESWHATAKSRGPGWPDLRQSLPTCSVDSGALA